VIAFRKPFDVGNPLDELVCEGARRALPAAIDAEAASFVAAHDDQWDDADRRLVVRNGSLPAREILTGAGPLAVSQRRRPMRVYFGTESQFAQHGTTTCAQLNGVCIPRRWLTEKNHPLNLRGNVTSQRPQLVATL